MIHNLEKCSEDEIAVVQEFVDGLIEARDKKFERLSGQEALLVNAVRAGKGNLVRADALSYQICPRVGDCVDNHHVTVVACKARKKSKTVKKHLKTVWGEGFMWVEDPA